MEDLKNNLSFNVPVEPGQWFDIRSEGLQPQCLYDIKVNEIHPDTSTKINVNKVNYCNLGENLTEALNISNAALVRNICYSKNPTIASFLVPSAPNYIMVKIEKTMKQKRVKVFNKVHDTTHYVKNVYYGNVVLLRLIPKNPNIIINVNDENFNDFVATANHDDYIIDTLTNFHEWRHHEKITWAMDYVYWQIEQRNDSAIRYDIEKMTKKRLWLEQEDLTEVLDKLLRLQYIIARLEKFLKRADTTVDCPKPRKYFTNLEEISAWIDAKANGIKENPILYPSSKMTVSTTMGYAKDLFQSLVAINSECQRFLRRKMLLLQRPSIENSFLDRELIFIHLYHPIIGFTDRYNFELIDDKLLQVIRNADHEKVVALKRQNPQKVLIIKTKNISGINDILETLENQVVFLTCISDNSYSPLISNPPNVPYVLINGDDRKQTVKSFSTSQELREYIFYDDSNNNQTETAEIQNYDDSDVENVYQKHHQQINEAMKMVNAQ